MALPVNIGDLLNKRKVEGSRIEFKKGWNPISIYHSPGPDRSIHMSAIERGDILKSRRYRNRYLGDFLKELELTEGRSTGVPTIQEKLAANGSLRATFETTDDRLTFLVHIPVHAGCDNDLLALANKNQLIGSEKTGNNSEGDSEKEVKSSEKDRTGSDKPQDVVQGILNAIRQNSKISAAEIAMKVGLSSHAVEKRVKTMHENGIIRRIGPDKGGYWEIITDE